MYHGTLSMYHGILTMYHGILTMYHSTLPMYHGTLVVYHGTLSYGEETFLKDFLVILKRMRNLVGMFPEYYMYDAVSNLQSHAGV